MSIKAFGSGSWILYTPCISLVHSRGMYTMQKRCSYSWLGKLANNPTILVRTSSELTICKLLYKIKRFHIPRNFRYYFLIFRKFWYINQEIYNNFLFKIKVKNVSNYRYNSHFVNVKKKIINLKNLIKI